MASSDPTSTVPTLIDYLRESHTLLSLILQIPPLAPSSALRVTFLLRLTGDVTGAIAGYRPSIEVLPQLLAWLNDLDRGWRAVLHSQAWDADESEGVIVPQPLDGDSESPTRSPMSQTERTRLRSLLISCTSTLEEWLVGLDSGEQDYTAILERMGLQQGFDELFTGTLSAMGSLNGVMNVPQGMEGTC